MAAGGFKEFVAGEILDEDDINDFLMQGVLVFAGTAARGSAIGTAVEGQFSFLKDSDTVEFYDGSGWVELSSGAVECEYVVVGGGGGAGTGSNIAGGGGAGGYRSSVFGENSGGTVSAEPKLLLASGTYRVTVGAGGAAATDGSITHFGAVSSPGGGAGGNSGANGKPGASGGGAGGDGTGFNRTGGAALVYLGLAGGNATGLNAVGPAGGGGGAGAVGGNGVSTTAGNGGAGVASSITGTSVTRAGGGGGGILSGTAGTGGAGGGGDGTVNGTGVSGAVNTGGGGGGTGGLGGSGIILLKYADSVTLTFGAGLTTSTSTSGGFKVTSITGGTDTITVP